MVLLTFVSPTTLVMIGADGAVVSMTTFTVTPAGPWFDAASEAFAVMLYVPVAKSVAGVYVHSPDPSAVVVPRTEVPWYMVTVEMFSAVPTMTGLSPLV